VTPYTWAWIFWIALFFVIEVPAILDRSAQGTLSEHVWRWFSIKEKSSGYRRRRFVLTTFLGWLVLHLLTGGWV
jgi:hypothetical protein